MSLSPPLVSINQSGPVPSLRCSEGTRKPRRDWTPDLDRLHLLSRPEHTPWAQVKAGALEVLLF